jgi:hypothetical protein
MTRVPNSTDPVTSTTMSISRERQIGNGSSATTGTPRRIASSTACWLPQTSTFSSPE